MGFVNGEIPECQSQSIDSSETKEIDKKYYLACGQTDDKPTKVIILMSSTQQRGEIKKI